MIDPMNLTDDEFEAYMNSGELEKLEETEELTVETFDEPEEEEVEESTEDEELEQPEDVIVDDSDDEVTDEEDDYTEEEDSEGETVDQPEADEEQSEDEVEETELEITKVQKTKYRANGEDFEFSDQEIKEQFAAVFGKAKNYDKKMQELAPDRRKLSALKDENISDDDLNLMIDAFKGNKDALATMLKKGELDAFDLETPEEGYKPNTYGKDEVQQTVASITAAISKDVEYGTTERVIDTLWDNASRDIIRRDLTRTDITEENPSIIEALHRDIKSGMYAKVAPAAKALKAQDGGINSDIYYYITAGKPIADKMKAEREAMLAPTPVAPVVKAKPVVDPAVKAAKAKVASQAKLKSASSKRKAAVPSKGGTGKSDVVDYLDIDNVSDDEFEAYMEEKLKG